MEAYVGPTQRNHYIYRLVCIGYLLNIFTNTFMGMDI